MHDDVRVETWSTLTLLRRRREIGPSLVHLLPRDRRRPWRTRLPDFAPEENSYGFLTCVARSDFERVDGFDMRFVGWGDQDVDLAVRLRRSGLRCGWAGPRATVLHLWHASNVPVERPTWELLEETKRSDRIEAIEGASRLSAEAGLLPTGTSAPAGANRRDG
jgi:GT2 family glycosyltransferase